MERAEAAIRVLGMVAETLGVTALASMPKTDARKMTMGALIKVSINLVMDLADQPSDNADINRILSETGAVPGENRVDAIRRIIARAEASEAMVQTWESTMATFLGCGYDTPKAAGLRIDKLLMRESELADVTEELGQLRSRLAAIDAAKAGDPPCPEFDPNRDYTEADLKAYTNALLNHIGTLLDTTAALRVELAHVEADRDSHQNTGEHLAKEVDVLRTRLARYQQAEGEVEPVPEWKPSMGSASCGFSNIATRLRDRLVGALVELAEAKRQTVADYDRAIESGNKGITVAREEGARAEREKGELFRGVVQELLDNLSIPERNCSCHLSPPCENCVEFGGLREIVSAVRYHLAPEEPVAGVAALERP